MVTSRSNLDRCDLFGLKYLKQYLLRPIVVYQLLHEVIDEKVTTPLIGCSS